MERELTAIEQAQQPTIELTYVPYEGGAEKSAGYLGYYERDNKVWAWLGEDGSYTYAVDLI